MAHPAQSTDAAGTPARSSALRLDGARLCVTIGNHEIGFHRLAEAVKALPPQQAGELLSALDREVRRLLQQERRLS